MLIARRWRTRSGPWLEGLGLIIEGGTIRASKPLPRYPLGAEDVPGNYVLKGDAYWYPHP